MIDEVVPDIFHKRANVRAVAVLVPTALSDSRSALATQCEESARVDEDVEIGLSWLTARVVKIEDCCEGTGLRWRDREIAGEQDGVGPSLLLALNAVGDLRPDIIALVRAAAGNVRIARFRVQA